MLQFAGFWMAAVTFLGIWWGHVGVRWLEAHSPRLGPPIVILAVLGLGLNIFSLLTESLTISGVASIIGITLLWDALEMWRQAKRIAHGHAPANPKNPRHAVLLAQPGTRATLENLLDRDPAGRPVSTTMPRLHSRPAGKRTYEEVEV